MNRCAIPSPMPWFPPVIAATLPSKRFDTSPASISTSTFFKRKRATVTLGCCGPVLGTPEKTAPWPATFLAKMWFPGADRVGVPKDLILKGIGQWLDEVVKGFL